MEHKRPWTLIESTMGFCHLIYTAEDRLVCTTEGSGGADRQNELANARLIAAAPSMLEALERCMEVLEITDTPCSDARDMARAAIAKASAPGESAREGKVMP